VCGTPGAIGTSSVICVYILSIPTCSAEPLTLDGRRSKSGKAVFPDTNQSNSCPVAKSIMCSVAAACCPCSTLAAYGAPDAT